MNILNCPALEKDNSEPISNYNDLFGNNHMKIKLVTQALKKKFAKFTTMKSTVHGQSHQTKPSAADSTDKVDNVDVVDNVNLVDCNDLELELE